MSTRTHMAVSIGQLLDGTLSGNDAVQFLQQQDMSLLTPYALAGAVDAVMERMIPFPAFPDAIDCCGTGGDGRATYNISTAVAFVLAARGVQVAKHGNRAVSSQSGSADVLQALGMNTHLSGEMAARILQKTNLTFLYAPTFHPGFAKLAPIRKAIGRRTILNLLGPLCNPARVKRQLIGVFAPEYCSLVAETAALLGHTHVMVVHGDDGTDELSICGNTHTAILQNGKITYASIRPQDAGLSPAPANALTGGNAMENARALSDVLDGVEGPYLDAVLLNAAAALTMMEKADTLEHGVALARSSIGRGDARRKLEELISESNDDV